MPSTVTAKLLRVPLPGLRTVKVRVLPLAPMVALPKVLVLEPLLSAVPVGCSTAICACADNTQPPQNNSA